MDRIPEPELMDDLLQVQAYAAADFSVGDQSLVDLILERLSTARQRIVDLGCGPGNISFRLAQVCPEAAVLGLDGAAVMLELAEQRRQAEPHRWGGLRFQRACLPLPTGALEDLPARWRPPFTTLVSNSLLHHLHDPQVLWRSLLELGESGALVVVRDLRRPDDPAALEALVERHAGDAPAVLRRDYRQSLRAAFRPAEVVEQLAATGLHHLTVHELGDRHLEVVGRLA